MIDLIPLIILLTISAHIFVDFHLQGILADMKQRSWWYSQFAELSAKMPDVEMPKIMSVYGHDYVAALLIHGLEWSVVVTLPSLILGSWDGYWPYAIGMVVAMGVIHSLIDHLKANEHLLNLIWDQVLHAIQLAVILAYFLL